MNQIITNLLIGYAGCVVLTIIFCYIAPRLFKGEGFTYQELVKICLISPIFLGAALICSIFDLVELIIDWWGQVKNKTF